MICCENIVYVALLYFFILPNTRKCRNYLHIRFFIDSDPYISLKGFRTCKLLRLLLFKICTYYFSEFTHVIFSTNLNFEINNYVINQNVSISSFVV